jgi:HEAT repeat protein
MSHSNGDQSLLENELRENRRKYAVAATPLLAELADAGYQISSISELARSKINYRPAIPILLRWLPLVEYVPLKEDILEALCVRYARPIAAPVLIAEYRRADNWLFKWAIGSALTYVADDSVFDDVVELLKDKRHGRGREMLAWALGKMKNPRAVDVLIELLDDEEVAGHALRPLGSLRAKKARRRVERFLTHDNAWIRQEARRALAKIDKAND